VAELPSAAVRTSERDLARHPGGRLTLALLAGLIAVMLVSIGIGAVPIPMSSIAGSLAAAVGVPVTVDETIQAIVVQIRLPRIALAVIVGMALAASGTVFQGLFRNPMADPYIIGVSGGAALGATIAIVLGVAFSLAGLSAVTLLAFLGALAVTLLVYRLAWSRNDVVPEHLLLAGVAVGAFLAAVISALQFAFSGNIQQVVFWLMGGFSGRTWDHLWLALPYVIAGYALARYFARDLNLLLLGDETARSLGVSAASSRRWLIAAGALMAAAAVAVSGLIGFVGLVVPHLMRLITGPDHRRLLPAAALAGGIALLLADTVARTVLAPTEIPVGIVTAGLGAPFFLYLLRKNRTRTYWS
jgi:iron complex transport system permease protein